jgi:hypothetical protein
MQAVREASPLGHAPHRKGRPFNRSEYHAAKMQAMLDFYDPGRPVAFGGGVLSDHAADDVRQLEHYESHPDMSVRRSSPSSNHVMLVRPSL